MAFNSQKAGSELRILFAIGSLELGGAESQMLMLTRELVRLKVYCEVFALETGGVLQREFESLGVTVINGRYSSSSNKALKVVQIFRATWILWRRARSATVLQAYLPLTNFMGALTGRLAGVNKVITCRRGLGTHQDRRTWWKFFDRTANSLSDVVAVNSQMVADDTIRRDKLKLSKLRCIYNGLDSFRFQEAKHRRPIVRQSLGLSKDEIALIIVANLIAYKGHSDLIEAFSLVVKNFPQLRMLVVGRDNGIGEGLKMQAEQLAVGEHIRWLGARRDIPDLLAASDVYVCASHEEGFSNSLLEALSAGIPVLATSVGGNPEALENGRLGVLVNPRDPKSLAVALDELLSDKVRMSNFGALAAETTKKKYSASLMANHYLEIYQGR